MIPSTLVTLVLSLAAVHGAVVPRDGTFTYLTPQPTSPLGGTLSAQTTTRTSPPPISPSITPSILPSMPPSMPPSIKPSFTPSMPPSVPPSIPPSTTTSSTPSTSPSASSSSSITQTAPQTSFTVVTSGKIITTIPVTGTGITGTVTTPVTTQTAPQTSFTVVTSGKITTTIPVTITPAPSAGTANCDGVQQWQASFAYTAGNRVIFNNKLFTALQWTYNNAPPAHPDQWAASGTCAQPIKNKANCNGVPAWQSTVAYTTGNQVTFNSHLWSAVQWTESNSPGDTSGSWMDLGVCA